MLHTPRKDNAAADAAANKALDGGSFSDICDFALEGFCNEVLSRPCANIGLMFSFDGASRGNPGRASHGNCAWWGEWLDGGFVSKGLLFCIGRRIGTQTNNIAEVRGLAFAAKAALHFQFWFSELCSRWAEDHKRHSAGDVL